MVRASTPADARAISDLWMEQSRRWESLGMEWNLSEGARERCARGVQGAAANPRSAYFVAEAEDGSRIAGFLHARVMLRSSVYRESVVGEIAVLAVSPGQEMGDIEPALLEAAMEWFRKRGIRQVEMAIPEGDHSSRDFLMDRGFHESSITYRAEIPQETESSIPPCEE